MANGTMSSGKKWMYSDGEILICGENAAGNMEWLVPYMGTLSEEDQDELVDLGIMMNHAREHGEAWVDEAIIGPATEAEWEGLDHAGFLRAVANSNAPAFPDEGEWTEAALDAAWNRLQHHLESA